MKKNELIAHITLQLEILMTDQEASGHLSWLERCCVSLDAQRVAVLRRVGILRVQVHSLVVGGIPEGDSLVEGREAAEQADILEVGTPEKGILGAGIPEPDVLGEDIQARADTNVLVEYKPPELKLLSVKNTRYNCQGISETAYVVAGNRRRCLYH